ncbi:hypothetical protein SAMN02745133_02052 [Desulforamulus putei DSM 12395]|uniref:Uncharacterized protein n=1 Tax=Desulforamulus putei DSM 12395 TaxID=1121429 RepID=A0A1M4ZQG4_9FIRM|nr:hypothetical protein SAMN02745133_02052 [Desulforamulus putei DSM 12395]
MIFYKCQINQKASLKRRPFLLRPFIHKHILSGPRNSKTRIPLMFINPCLGLFE